jgi:hypothetical protein
MTIPSSLRRASRLFSLGLVLLAAPLGAAEQPAQPVQIKIGTIMATNQAECLDSQLAKLKQQLEVVKYRCYRLMREDNQRGNWQNNSSFDIAGGRSLNVTPLECRNNRVSLKVRLLEGEKPIVDTTVRFPNKGNFLLGGPAHEGGVLILSISAMANCQ